MSHAIEKNIEKPIKEAYTIYIVVETLKFFFLTYNEFHQFDQIF